MQKRLSIKTFTFVVLFTLFTPTKSFAENEDQAWQALRNGKAIAILRHALAPSGVDNSNLTRDECKGERNLSQQGREQAKSIGIVFRERGISEAQVYTSKLCRSFDTAELLDFISPEILPVINGFFPQRTSSPEQTAELKTWISKQLSEPNKPIILVTHGFNITDLTGEYVAQGEFLIISMQGDSVSTLLRVNTLPK